MSEFEKASLPMDKLMVRLRSWLGKLGPKLNQVVKKNKSAQAHAFMLKEAARLSQFQMSDESGGSGVRDEPERRECLGEAAGHSHITAHGGL